MSNYLSNLAATVVQPGSGVAPRLPGRFEPQHPVSTSPFDVEAPNAAEMVSTSDKSVPLATPASTSGDLTVPLAESPAQVASLGDPPLLTIPPSLPMTEPERLTRPSQPLRAETAQPGAQPDAPVSPEIVLPDVRPTNEPPAIDIGKQPIDPGQAKPVPPLSMPGVPAAATGSQALHPLIEREPMSPAPTELQSVRSQSPTPLPEGWPGSASELFTVPVQAVVPHVQPIAQGATLAGVDPSASLAPLPSSVEPILGPVNGSPAVEAQVIASISDRPLHQAEADLAPTIRVTIGRIEIRATVPAAPPRTQPVRRQPVLPLEQYLQRRNEGKR